MILGIGIDSVEIERFAHWHTYNCAQLHKVFSQTEIDYCLMTPKKSAERFAARWAAKEALFKAWCAASKASQLSLLMVSKFVSVRHADNGVPFLHVDWSELEHKAQLSLKSRPRTHLSLTHTRQAATAIVIIEK